MTTFYQSSKKFYSEYKYEFKEVNRINIQLDSFIKKLF